MELKQTIIGRGEGNDQTEAASYKVGADGTGSDEEYASRNAGTAGSLVLWIAL
jgi:hypothetical protein